jgi:hypothetical protein
MFLFFKLSRPAVWPTESPVQGVPWGFSPSIKLLGLEVNLTPPSSAEIRAIPPLLHMPSWGVHEFYISNNGHKRFTSLGVKRPD